MIKIQNGGLNPNETSNMIKKRLTILDKQVRQFFKQYNSVIPEESRVVDLGDGDCNIHVEIKPMSAANFRLNARGHLGPI